MEDIVLNGKIVRWIINKILTKKIKSIIGENSEVLISELIIRRNDDGSLYFSTKITGVVDESQVIQFLGDKL